MQAGFTTDYDNQYPANTWRLRIFRVGCVVFAFSALTAAWNGVMCVMDSAHYGWLKDLLPPLVWTGIVAGGLIWQRRRMISESNDKALIIAVTTRIFLVASAVIGSGYTFRLLTIVLPEPIISGIVGSLTSLGISQSWAKFVVIACAWLVGFLVGWFVLGKPLWRWFETSLLPNSTSKPT